MVRERDSCVNLNCSIGDACAAAAIGQGLATNKALKKLDLSYNSISAEAAAPNVHFRF